VTTWDVDIPFERPLSLNDRHHHMVKARLVTKWRETAGWAIKAARIPPCQKVSVEFLYYPRDNRRRDPDNLVASMKPVVDALVDVGVVPDDTEVYVYRSFPSIQPAQPKRTGGRFLLRVTRLA
jgi:crossover junction endodeoxyribonuclease RusA